MAVMMLVVAMLVVVMVVMVMMVIAVIVRRMIVRGVIFVRVTMSATGIGAAFGIERRLDLDDARPQSLHHRFDDMIAADAQALGHDLGRQMAVAEMPGDPDQMMRIGTADFEQRLRRRHHLDQPAIVEHQRVAAAQRDRVFEIEQKFASPRVPVIAIRRRCRSSKSSTTVSAGASVQRCCGLTCVARII